MASKAKPHTHPPGAYRDCKVVVVWIALRLSEFGLMPVTLTCDVHFGSFQEVEDMIVERVQRDC